MCTSADYMYAENTDFGTQSNLMRVVLVIRIVIGTIPGSPRCLMDHTLRPTRLMSLLQHLIVFDFMIKPITIGLQN